MLSKHHIKHIVICILALLGSATCCTLLTYDPVGARQGLTVSFSSGVDINHVGIAFESPMFYGARPKAAHLTSPQYLTAAEPLPFTSFNCSVTANADDICIEKCFRHYNIQQFTSSYSAISDHYVIARGETSTETGFDLVFTYELTVPSPIAIIDHAFLLKGTATRWIAVSSDSDVVISENARVALIGGYIHKQELIPSSSETAGDARFHLSITILTGTTFTISDIVPSEAAQAAGVSIVTYLTDTRLTDTQNSAKALVMIRPTETTDGCTFASGMYSFYVTATNSADGGSSARYTIELGLTGDHVYSKAECVDSVQFRTVVPRVTAHINSRHIDDTLQPITFTSFALVHTDDAEYPVSSRVLSYSLLMHRGLLAPDASSIADALPLRGEDGTISDLARALDFHESSGHETYAEEHTAEIVINNYRLLVNDLIPDTVDLSAILIYIVEKMEVVLVGGRRLVQANVRELADGGEEGRFVLPLVTIDSVAPISESIPGPSSAPSAPVHDKAWTGLPGLVAGCVAAVGVVAVGAAVVYRRTNSTASQPARGGRNSNSETGLPRPSSAVTPIHTHPTQEQPRGT